MPEKTDWSVVLDELQEKKQELAKLKIEMNGHKNDIEAIKTGLLKVDDPEKELGKLAEKLKKTRADHYSLKRKVDAKDREVPRQQRARWNRTKRRA